MVRAGLAHRWRCLFANDSDELKAEVYSANWGSDRLKVDDIHALSASDLPARADLAWASFPCQDLSCAGNGLGLGNRRGKCKTRSGTFWPFIAIMEGLKTGRRAPTLIVIENVLGLLTTGGGEAFQLVAAALAKLDYRFGAIVIDAKWFVPQSRPRIFIVAVAKGAPIPEVIVGAGPKSPWHPDQVVRSYEALPPSIASKWIWLDPGKVPRLRKRLADIVSDDPADGWHSKSETRRLISMMSPENRRKMRLAAKSKQRKVASLFLRMRPVRGRNLQRAEVSFADVSGCLRTPKGGGSRPRVLVVKGTNKRTRLLSPKEAAKLMGLKTNYKLPTHYDAAFKVIGDGVVVPVVAFLRSRILEPILRQTAKSASRRKHGQGRASRAVAITLARQPMRRREAVR